MYAAYKYILLHVIAYYCIIYIYLCPSSPVLCTTPLWNLASSFAAALAFTSRTFSTIMNLQNCSQNGPEESGCDNKINGMHPIAHEHLVHTEVGDQPKHIENQIQYSFSSVFLVRGIGPVQ